MVEVVSAVIFDELKIDGDDRKSIINQHVSYLPLRAAFAREWHGMCYIYIPKWSKGLFHYQKTCIVRGKRVVY